MQAVELPPGARADADAFEPGSFVAERDTGRPLRVLSHTYLSEPPASELLDLSRLAREHVEHYARARGVGLREARVELGYKAPPPMWGDGASAEEPDVRRVVVEGSSGVPFWIAVDELVDYRAWFAGRLLGAFRSEQLGLALELEGAVPSGATTSSSSAAG